ncbi:MAG: DUF885 family protein [Henriciella sp.]
MVGQQLRAQEMQLLQEFHEPDTKYGFAYRLKTPVMTALIAAFVCLSGCSPNAESNRLNSRDLARSTTILDEVTATELLMSPETASYIGAEALGTKETSARLDDHSQAGFERKRLVRLDLLSLVQMRPILPPDHPLARDLQIIDDSLSRTIALQVIGHGRLSLSDTHPYAIDPYSGPWIDIPGLMVNDQLVRSQSDAEAYLDRLWALSGAIDDTRRRLIADAQAGVTPPAALLHKTSQAVSAFADPETGKLNIIDTTFRNLVQGVAEIDPEIADQMSRDATSVINFEVRPAYNALSETLLDLAANASIHGGIWAQPDGHQAYKRLLEWQMDHDGPLDQLHSANEESTALYQEQFNRTLAEAGFAEGAISNRLLQLQNQIDTNLTEAPSAPLLNDEPLPELTLQNRSAVISINRALTSPPLFGYRYLPARLDEQRPALISEYPEQISKWPAYMHAALGLQADVGLRQPFANMGAQRRPAARALATYPAFQAGWRILAIESFAEDYIQNSEDQIGLAHLLLANAALATADTGLHHKRWTIDETATYLRDTTALPENLIEEAVLRIAAKPGEHASRMISYRRLLSLRNRAKAVLNATYDEVTFHSILITDGPRPFSLIEQDVDRWYQSKLPASENSN